MRITGEVLGNIPDNDLNPSGPAVARLFADAFQAATLNHENVLRINASPKAIRDRIDRSCSHCTDLPEINKRIPIAFL